MFGQDLYWIRLSEGSKEEAGDRKRGGKEDNCPKIEGIYPNATSVLGAESVEENFTLAPRAEKKEIWLACQDICSLEVRVLGRKDYQRGLGQSWELWTEVEELDAGSGGRDRLPSPNTWKMPGKTRWMRLKSVYPTGTARETREMCRQGESNG